MAASTTPKPRKPRTTAKKPGSKGTAAALTRIQFLERRVGELEADQAAARARPSWIAVRQLGQDLDAAHRELVELRAAEVPEDAGAGVDALALTLELVGELPLADVETVLEACESRLRPGAAATLRVV